MQSAQLRDRKLRGAGCWLLACIAFTPLAGLAQESPVEIIERSAPAEPSTAPNNRNSPQPRQASSNLSALFHELQLLQNEVMNLRGELEELTYRLDEVTRQQSAQYMDLDRRLRRQPVPTGEISGELQVGETGDAISKSPDSTSETPATTRPLSEEDSYQQVFALVEGRQFEQAVTAFDQFLIAYPNGDYTPNAFYWLGELHLQLDDLEKSRQSFVQVLTLFPDNPKVPDSLYKLGVVYNRLGDAQTAEDHLQRVLAEHPNTTAAGLAREYLRQRG